MALARTCLSPRAASGRANREGLHGDAERSGDASRLEVVQHFRFPPLRRRLARCRAGEAASADPRGIEARWKEGDGSGGEVARLAGALPWRGSVRVDPEHVGRHRKSVDVSVTDSIIRTA